MVRNGLNPRDVLTIIFVLAVMVNFLYTVDGERFTGLNFHGFSTIEVFMEILSCCLGHKC